jgi:hypothetical protein
LEDIQSQILTLKEKYFSGNFNLKSTFARLFEEKLDELLLRIDLIRAYKKQKFDLILKYNEELFGKLDQDLLRLAKEKIFIEEYDESIL